MIGAKTKTDVLLDELVKDCDSPEDIFEKHGLQNLSSPNFVRMSPPSLTIGMMIRVENISPKIVNKPCHSSHNTLTVLIAIEENG